MIWEGYLGENALTGEWTNNGIFEAREGVKMSDGDGELPVDSSFDVVAGREEEGEEEASMGYRDFQSFTQQQERGRIL